MEFSSHKRRFSATSPTPNPAPSNCPLTTIHHVSIGTRTIESTVTNDEPTITQWLTDMSSLHSTGKAVIVGLDVKWKPNRNKYTNNRAATLQLCIGTRCLIIQLIHVSSIPQSLYNFLSDTPQMTFVGIEVENDVAKLTREYGLTCQRIRDLREATVAAGVGPALGPRLGLKGLAREIVGLEIEKPKSVTLSNWEVRALSEMQVRYACIDAYASYCVGHKLLIQD